MALGIKIITKAIPVDPCQAAMMAAVLNKSPKEQSLWKGRAWGVCNVWSPARQKKKERKKSWFFCPVFYCIFFPFFSLLVKRLHFLAIEVAQDQGSAARDLCSWRDSLGCDTRLQTSVCKTVSSTTACKGHYEVHRKSNSSKEGRKCLWHSIRNKMPFSKAFVGYQAEWIGIRMRNCAINTSNRLSADDFPYVRWKKTS